MVISDCGGLAWRDGPCVSLLLCDQAGDGDSPEFVSVSLCPGFLVNGCGEVDLHIVWELPTGKYLVDNVSEDGNDERCSLETPKMSTTLLLARDLTYIRT